MENNHIKRPDLCPGQLSIFDIKDIKPKPLGITSLRIVGAKGIGVMTIDERAAISRAINWAPLGSCDSGKHAYISEVQASISFRAPFEWPNQIVKPPFWRNLLGEKVKDLAKILFLRMHYCFDQEEKKLLDGILIRLNEELLCS